MYGSTLARTYYGAGDYNRRAAYVQGYYAAGGFGSFLKKAAGVVSKVASNPLVGTALSFVPGGGLIAKGAQMAGKILPGIAGGVLNAAGGSLFEAAKSSAKALLSGGGAGGAAGAAAKATLPALVKFAGGPERGGRRSSSRRRRRSSSRRRRSGGTSRRRRRAGDYGDDWKGNTPSRAKGNGRFLTRRGGRRRRRSRGRGGGRVSFVTKSGKRVSFTARRGDGDDA